MRRRRHGINAGLQPIAFVFERLALRIQSPALAVERHATLRRAQAGLLLRRLQDLSRGVVAAQPNDPIR